MRILVLVLFYLVAQPLPMTFPEATNVVWYTNFKEAQQIAKQDQKNILIYFTGSDWCTPCKKLKTDLFETEDFREISKNYTLVYVDIPRNKDLLTNEQLAHNKKLLSQYNKKGVFPLFKVTKSNGKAIDEYSGYSMNGDVSYHLGFLKKNQ